MLGGVVPVWEAELRARIEELENALAEVDELIEGYVDVIDGDEVSGPRPNRAMQAQRIINGVLGEAL